MLRIKICGIRKVADLEAVADAGADAVGFNFHPPSVRFLETRQAAELSRAAAELKLFRVGVFVSADPGQIADIADRVGLDAVQLHGDQTVDDARRLCDRNCRVIRVIRLPRGRLDPLTIAHRVAPWVDSGYPLLLDAEVGLHGGGQGARLDWDAVGDWAAGDGSEADCGGVGDWILAGGLDPLSVAEAIHRSRAVAVDVASGVERTRGEKCRQKIADFVSAARAAWAAGPAALGASGRPAPP